MREGGRPTQHNGDRHRLHLDLATNVQNGDNISAKELKTISSFSTVVCIYLKKITNRKCFWTIVFCVLAQVQMSTIAYSDRNLVDISTDHIFCSGGQQGCNSGYMHLDNSTIDAHLYFCGRGYFQNFHPHSKYYEPAKSPTQSPEKGLPSLLHH